MSTIIIWITIFLFVKYTLPYAFVLLIAAYVQITDAIKWACNYPMTWLIVVGGTVGIVLKYQGVL